MRMRGMSGHLRIARPAVAAVSLLVPLTFYFARMAPSLTWLDSGELAAASYTLGTSHPPGHPLYLVLGKLLSYALPGNVAFRYNLVSVVFAIATLAAAAAMIRHVLAFVTKEDTAPSSSGALASDVCAGAGALVLAFIPAFAVQALRAEVYSLSFLIETLLVFACVKVFTSPEEDRPRMAVPIVFLAGLGLSVHNFTAILMYPACAICLFAILRGLVGRRREMVKHLLVIPLVFAASLFPYAFIVVRSLKGPYIDLAHADTPRRLLDVFSASAYRGSFTHAGVGFDVLLNLKRFWAIAGGPILPAVLLLAAVGGWVLFRKSRLMFLAAAATVVSTSLGLFLQKDLNAANPDHGAYVFPAILVAVLLSAVAVRSAGELRALRNLPRGGPVAGRMACMLVAALLALFQLVSAAEAIDMNDSTTASAHADLLDRILPADSIVFLNSDEVGFPLLYLQAAEGRRLDMTLGVGLMYSDREAYGVARKFWPGRLPAPGAMKTSPSVHASARKGGYLLDAIVNHAGGRYPLILDHFDKDIIDPRFLVPYYHLAVILPPGLESLAGPWLPRASEEDMVRVFHEFFIMMNVEDADLFALHRLAIGPLSRTGALYYRKQDMKGVVVANTIALGFSPDEPGLLYSRGVAFERSDNNAEALVDYLGAWKLSEGNEALMRAVTRVKKKLSGAAAGDATSK
jgi:hypothetical protein